MTAPSAKVRSLLARWFGPRRQQLSATTQPQPARTADSGSAAPPPLFSLGETTQELVASYRNAESERR